MKDTKASEGKAEAKMERALIFTRSLIGIDPVVETNRTDGQSIAQTTADGVTHIPQPRVFGGRQKISGIGKEGALKLAENREGIFGIEDGEKFAAERIAILIERPEFALAEASHGRAAAVEKALV